MLDIKNFSKSYKSGKKAVDNLSLTVSPGDVYGFIGHNGAGKTTTLRSVAGILAFEEGEISVDGKSIKTDPIDCKRAMAYVPDNPELYDNLTGARYLRFICDVYDISANLRKERIDKYAGAFDILDKLGDAIGSYSHGMKQKIALVAALVHSPKLLLLDEPFVGLDPIAAVTLKTYMHELCADGGAIFFSTHVLDVAEKLCNRIAIIKQGRLIADGTMDDVKGDTSLENVFIELTEGNAHAE